MKKAFRTILSVMLIAALMASFSVVAFAADKEFKFELTLKTVDDVVLKSAKNELSVKKAAPELFDRYSGQQIAYFVAYDCFLKNREYTVEEDAAKNTVIFKFDGPATVLVPSVIDVTANKDLDVVVLAVDIPDGTELTVTVGSDPSKEFTGKVKGGAFEFTLPKDFLKDYATGDALPVVVEYEVDGKSFKDSVTVPAVDGAKTGTAAKDPAETPVLYIPSDTGYTGGGQAVEPAASDISKALGDKNGFVLFFGPLGGMAFEEKDNWIFGKDVDVRYIPQQFGQIGAGAVYEEEYLPGIGVDAGFDATVGVSDVLNLLFNLIVEAAK